MFGHYGTAIGAMILMGIVVGFVQGVVNSFANINSFIGETLSSILSLVVSVLTGMFVSGRCYLYLKVACNQHVSAGDIFYGFRLFPGKAILIQLFITLLNIAGAIPLVVVIFVSMAVPNEGLTVLLYCLAIIIYIVVAVFVNLAFSQAMFLLHDFPQHTARELFGMSRRLMQGSKGRLFYLYVSFIPLYLLCALSFGIGFLWLTPYVNATLAEFFLDLARNKNAQ